MYTLGSFVLFLLNLEVILCARNYNIEFERVEGISGDEETLVENDIRLSRQGKQYVVNGNLTYYDDLGEDIMHMVKTAYSADGSSRFRAYPYNVQKSSICEFFKTIYRKYGQSWIQGHTDFPFIPEEGLCPLPKGTYYVREVSILDGTNLPIHAPNGLWKLEQTFEKNGKLVGGLRIYVKVSNKLF